MTRTDLPDAKPPTHEEIARKWAARFGTDVGPLDSVSDIVTLIEDRDRPDEFTFLHIDLNYDCLKSTGLQGLDNRMLERVAGVYHRQWHILALDNGIRHTYYRARHTPSTARIHVVNDYARELEIFRRLAGELTTRETYNRAVHESYTGSLVDALHNSRPGPLLIMREDGFHGSEGTDFRRIVPYMLS